MNKLTDNINNIEPSYDCKYCSASSILLSSNFRNKEYLLYFQNDNIRLIQMDELGIDVLGEIKVGYCVGCGREL